MNTYPHGRYTTAPLASPQAMKWDPPLDPEPEQEDCAHSWFRVYTKECADVTVSKFRCIHCHAPLEDVK